MKKTKQELLAELIKANKKRRPSIARRQGFNSVEEYLLDLKSKKVTKTVLAKTLRELINTNLTVTYVKDDGSKRTLTGFHTGKTDDFGRIKIQEKTVSGNRLKLVDTRTLQSITTDKFKLTLK